MSYLIVLQRDDVVAASVALLNKVSHLHKTARSLKSVILFHSSPISLEQYLHYCQYLNRHVQDEVLLTYESFQQLYMDCNEVTSPHLTPEKCSLFYLKFASLIIQDYYMQMLVHYDVLLTKNV